MESKYDAIKQREKLEVFVDAPEWETKVRLIKLNDIERLRFFALQNECEQDQKGNVTNDKDLLKLAIEILALSIADDDDPEVRPFDDAEGRLFISRAPIELINRLGSAAIDLNGFGSSEDIIAAKNG